MAELNSFIDNSIPEPKELNYVPVPPQSICDVPGAGVGAGERKKNRSEPLLPCVVQSLGRETDKETNSSGVIMGVSLREGKNALRRKETVCCREKGLVLPSERDIRKVFRQAGNA